MKLCRHIITLVQCIYSNNIIKNLNREKYISTNNYKFTVKTQKTINYISNKKYKMILAENNLYYDIYDDNYIDISHLQNDLLLYKSNYNTDTEIYEKFIKKNKNKNKKKENNQDEYNKFCTKLYKKSLKDTVKKLSAEHIYPQSYLKNTKKSVYDIHNIYLTSQYYNSYRSNYKFIDENQIYDYKLDSLIYLDNNLNENVNIKDIIYNKYSNYKNNNYKIFIPSYKNRGAIARSIAYMSYFYPELNINDVIDIDTLIRWNELYPPSIYEIKKNKINNYIQGNSNIFIDDPNNIKYL
jgi:endonuclease I|tara:strand:+ start:44 stop:931 length:888 start_codon:yes stop_codon:yes gene_type:complete